MSGEKQNELITQGHNQAQSELGGLLSNYQFSNDADRPMAVDALRDNFYKQNRDLVKKMFDSAAAIRDKPDQTFSIPELPGVAIPKKLFLQDLKTPARHFMANYDRKNYQNLESLKKAKPSSASSAKSGGSYINKLGGSPNLQAAKKAVFGQGFGGIGNALKDMAGLKPTRGMDSRVRKNDRRRGAGQLGRSGTYDDAQGGSRVLGPQAIKPPIGRGLEMGRAMNLNAAQSEARQGQERIAPREGLDLSTSGLESELGAGDSGQAVSTQPNQSFNPENPGYNPENPGSAYSQTRERTPGSIPTETEEELETTGGGRPESELERLKTFQSAQRQSSLSAERLTGEPSIAAKAGLTADRPEAATAQKVSRPQQPVSERVGFRKSTGTSGASDGNLANALLLRARQMQAQSEQNKINQLSQAKDSFEALKRGKQSFKNLVDAAQAAAGGSWVTLLTLLAEWNADLVNKHVADSKIPFLEKKPSPGTNSMDKVISNVKDGVTIFADIVFSVSCLAVCSLPLIIIVLIIIAQTQWGLILSFELNNIFGH